MASELRVNTLKDASGNNSVAMSTVAEGSAKVWSNLNGTGTIALRDSFNVGSATDQGTGDYTINFTNSMNNDDYSVSANAGQSDKNFPRVCACGTAADSGFATSSHGILSQRPDNQADDDMEFVVSSVHGDLA
tara:strand:- start:2575 stop:2973 length:399 start_codon:yes stop_codon:yes gene_type:complete